MSNIKNKKDASLSREQRLWAEGLHLALESYYGASFREMHEQPAISSQLKEFAARPENHGLTNLYKKLFPKYRGDIESFTRKYWNWPRPATPESKWTFDNAEWSKYASLENSHRLNEALNAKEYKPLTPAKIERCFRKLVESGELRPIEESKC
jgi:hypothetical protein